VSEKRKQLGYAPRAYNLLPTENMVMTITPDSVKEEYLDYLDELRESGDTNMYGAGPFLMEEFPDLSKAEARAIVSYWMQTFPRKPS
jgi:hypothetical protein